MNLNLLSIQERKITLNNNLVFIIDKITEIYLDKSKTLKIQATNCYGSDENILVSKISSQVVLYNIYNSIVNKKIKEGKKLKLIEALNKIIINNKT